MEKGEIKRNYSTPNLNKNENDNNHKFLNIKVKNNNIYKIYNIEDEKKVYE